MLAGGEEQQGSAWGEERVRGAGKAGRDGWRREGGRGGDRHKEQSLQGKGWLWVLRPGAWRGPGRPVRLLRQAGAPYGMCACV